MPHHGDMVDYGSNDHIHIHRINYIDPLLAAQVPDPISNKMLLVVCQQGHTLNTPAALGREQHVTVPHALWFHTHLRPCARFSPTRV
eukprot:5462377-Amphidinium_carterae.1